VTTLTPDLLAHLAAVRDGECDDTDLLALADAVQEAGDEDRAELLRAQVELSRTPMFYGECKVCAATPDEEGWIRHVKGCYVVDSDGGGEEPADRNPDWESLRTRERDLLARNPAWLSAPCPECYPEGKRHVLCALCHASGDLLKSRATVTRGFLDVTLPHTLCWRLEEMPSTQCAACRGRGARAWHAGVSGQGCGECGNHDTIDLWRPHPVLRAVLASPVGPWVRRVRVEGREPFVDHDRDSAGWQKRSVGVRVWHGNPPSEREPYLIPDPVFDLLGGEPGVGNSRRFPTAEAATDALSLAVPRWARGAK